MNDSAAPSTAQPREPPDGGQAAVEAGARLRHAREAAGVHIAALAVSLKVSTKKLEALEAGQLDQLPDAVFARALAASVCRALKLDPAPVLGLLPQAGASQLLKLAESGLNAPYREPGRTALSGLRSQLSRPAVLVVLALVLAALVLVLLPVPLRQGGAPGGAPSRPASSDALPGEDDAKAQPSLPAPERSTQPAPAIPAAPPASAGGQPVPAAPEAASAPAGGSGKAAGELIVLRAQGESWVEATDASGKVVLRRLLLRGEMASASGVPPLSVVVGRADVTRVEVRGKPFDLTPLVRDNVARFEVK